MKKSFPTAFVSRPLKWAAVACAVGLTGCVGYYPDPYGTSPQPYYGGGGGGAYYDPYYDNGYYGPSYNSTTIYYQTYSPGYYYRPGYGYYPPPPRRGGYGGHDRDDHHDRDRNRHTDDIKRNWAERFDRDKVTGNNPGRYPHDRDDRRNDDRNGRDDDRRGPPPRQPPPPRDSGRGNGGSWSDRISGDTRPAPRFEAPRAQPVAPPPPRRQDDRDGSDRSRDAWRDRLRKAD